MHQPLQSIIQHLFQVSDLDDVSRQRLESFVEEYPSFGIGHYLLSQKLRTEDPEHFREAAQRTGLYFSNPLWLQWLLDNGTATNGSAQETPTPAFATEHEMASPENDAPLETVFSVPEPLAIEEPTADTRDETVEAFSGIHSVSAAEELLLRIEEAKGLRESLQKINDDFSTDAVRHEEPIHDEETPYVLDEAHESPEPAPATPGPDLVFEPYHTIDYFASQGIRLTLDENPGDTLGKQLKSFTEWLKVMRRLPQKDRESSVPDRVAEQAVQHFAAHSNQSKDVVTETMAEVLLKQGMRDRARAIYEKLSLLNPDKKAYFAAKIEQLNIP